MSIPSESRIIRVESQPGSDRPQGRNGRSQGCFHPRHRRTPVISPSSTTSQDTTPGLPSLAILLAEDTPTNQRVVSTILAKRNHSVDVADNGHQVLERMKGRKYDLILMDVQMPGMNGFEATSLIRSLEAATGERTPIIALTAHSAEEDLQRCRLADMDAWLTKPIDARRLVEVVEGVTRRSRGAPRVTNAPAPETGRSDGGNAMTEPLDLQSALERLGGNRKLLESMSHAFQDESAELVSELRQALSEANGERVSRAAHSLGGLAAAFDARDAVAVARRIEQSGRAGDLTLASSDVGDLERQIERLRTVLVEHFVPSSC